MQQYRVFLREKFAKASAARKLVVARKLLEEAVERGLISHNPARRVTGYTMDDDPTTPHQALRSGEAFRLLSVIDLTTKQGTRDYAMLMLLIRTGLRRSECAALCLGDLGQELGHHVAMLRQTKADKRLKIKIPVAVRRAIEEYLEACDRQNLPANAPLFIQFRKGDHPCEQPISGQVVARVVEKYATLVGLKISPHSLRATFVTLALEGGAKLQQVQYAVGHADPRTTERYQQRKLNLDNNAVDFVQIAPD
jgi:site-specific recombinase XerD